MKKHIYVLLFSIVCLTLRAKDDWIDVRQILNNPTKYLEEIARQIPSADKNLHANGSLTNNLQMMAYAINQEIMAAESPNLLQPTDARKAVIQKWGVILDSYTSKLVDLALSNESFETSAGAQSRSLLDFAASSPRLAQEVRKYLTDPNPHATQLAADLLFEHRLLSDEDQTILILRMNEASSESEMMDWGRQLAAYGIQPAVNMMLTKAREVLKQKPESQDTQKLVDQYALPLRAASLGQVSVDLVPGLKTALLGLDSSQLGLKVMFENAIEVASGRKEIVKRIARNGSGPLIATAIGQTNGSTDLPKPEQEDQQAKLPSAIKVATQPPMVPQPESPSWRVWLLVVIAATVGAVWVFLRKSK